ncbi:MAG: hypothetical protein IPN03_08185 [Holophagales bacterium]|nr:hypothetical protein [Holophagales bacterium]
MPAAPRSNCSQQYVSGSLSGSVAEPVRANGVRDGIEYVARLDGRSRVSGAGPPAQPEPGPRRRVRDDLVEARGVEVGVAVGLEVLHPQIPAYAMIVEPLPGS